VTIHNTTYKTAALLLITATTLSLAACDSPSASAAVTKATADKQLTPKAVTIVEIAPHMINGALTASGDLVPLQEAAVLPEMPGYRVIEVFADVGDSVKQGQVLAKLDPALLEDQLAQQEALAAHAEAQAVQAEEQAQRVADLDDAGVLSEEQIRERRLQAQAARQNAIAQAALLRDMRTRVTKLAVIAPVAGLVLERTVRPGDLAANSSTAWFKLAKDSVIELQAQLSEADLANVRLRQHATVTLPSGATADGVVRLISPQIDPHTNLGWVRITLPVRPDIRAGGFARAEFNDVSGMALSVPETALRYDADGASVMLVDADNHARRYPVRTGMRGSGLVQLIEGPPPGSRVVRSAASFLLDGDSVQALEQAP
jgi:HlyD family secretion protein